MNRCAVLALVEKEQDPIAFIELGHARNHARLVMMVLIRSISNRSVGTT